MTSPAHARRAPRVSRRRRIIALLGVVLVLVAAVAIVWVVNRQFWFVGTDDQGQVTLYRGLPYDLPLGIDLYSEQYVSPVPARTLPASSRKRIIDHSLRSKGDARDLVRQVEQGRIQN